MPTRAKSLVLLITSSYTRAPYSPGELVYTYQGPSMIYLVYRSPEPSPNYFLINPSNNTWSGSFDNTYNWPRSIPTNIDFRSNPGKFTDIITRNKYLAIPLPLISSFYQFPSTYPEYFL